MSARCVRELWKPFRTIFIAGPCYQLKKMFEMARLFSTIALLVCILLTIIMAIIPQRGLAIVFAILTWVAYAWYILSYIPFAHDAIIKFLTCCWKGE